MTKLLVPTKICAHVKPLSTAGVSEKMVSVRENGISCDRFIASVNIERGKARLEVFTKRVGTSVSCPSSCTLESVLDGRGRDPTEEATKLFILLRSVSSRAALVDNIRNHIVEGIG